MKKRDTKALQKQQDMIFFGQFGAGFLDNE